MTKKIMTQEPTINDASIASKNSYSIETLLQNDLDALFERPDFLNKPSAWFGHIPFAHWIIKVARPRLLVELGTHTGVSYSAFCSSALREKTQTKCFAVDTWAGDEHAGHYSDQVYDNVKSYNDKHYPHFSTLLRSTFDEALEHFEDKSIDLLHIDGFHTYEAVSHDFTSWQSKLSDRAIVLFHDTNEHKKDFGVWRFWAEISQRYPSFEFLHSHGLGVLAYGQHASRALLELCNLRDEKKIVAVRDRFTAFGSLWSIEAEAIAKQARYEEKMQQMRADAQRALNEEREINKQISKEQSEFKKTQSDTEQKVLNLGRENQSLTRRMKEKEHEALQCRMAMEKTIKILEKKNESLNQYSMEQENQLIHLLAEKNAIISSRSWRLTEPLRALTRSIPKPIKNKVVSIIEIFKFLKDPKSIAHKLRNRKAYKTLKSSPLFDKKWYLTHNPDVAVASIDPISHYINNGANELRNPSNKFDTEFYLNTYPDVSGSHLNPLYHYIRYGQKEGRHPLPDGSPPTSTLPLEVKERKMRGPVRWLDAWRSSNVNEVTIIVPIFNAYDAVSECITSLINTVDDKTTILLVDDCSTDSRIPILLAKYENQPRIRVVQNTENLGYTRSINKAIKLCADTDIVLLNSDTVVTHRWLENIRYCAYAYSKVATVTPLSDNAGAFSVPQIGVANSIPPHLSTDAYARLVTGGTEGVALKVPTGNGFCMYIRRAAIAELGYFDEIKFPRGYGEENDFCMRAIRNGWLNLVCDKAIVFHKRSQSFGDEKKKLMEEGALHMKASYPEYKILTQTFNGDEFIHMRALVAASIKNDIKDQRLPRTAYVISTRTGGTPQTNMDLMRAMNGSYHCFLLHCDAKNITFSELKSGRLDVLESHTLSVVIDPISHRSDEYDAIVLDMLYRHSIELLHIRHIAWHSLGLAEAAKSIDIPVVYSGHDFYAVCPSLNLLDENLKYCGGRCTSGNGTCQIGLWPHESLPPLKHHFINRWQEMFNTFLSNCDHLITTTKSAADVFSNIYPDVREKITVIPHGRDFPRFQMLGSQDLTQEKIKILVPGNIGVHKGARLIQAIAELDIEGRIEFNFMGIVWDGLKDIGVHHGSYDRSNFELKINAIKPHFGVVLSIWPETYCHTLTEMWACGLPVMGIDLGAVGDRLRKSNAGWLIDPMATASQVLEQIYSAVADLNDFQCKLQAVQKWQNTEGIWNNTATMAVAYRRIYKSVALIEPPSSIRNIGLLLKGDQRIGNFPATAYIRLIEPMKSSLVDKKNIVFPVNSEWLLAGGLDVIDSLIIQRDAVPAPLLSQLLGHIKRREINYIYEIDDLLWDLPDDLHDHAIDTAQANSIIELIRNAATVTTSNKMLSEAVATINKKTMVIPNALSRELWLKPIDIAEEQRIQQENSIIETRPRILYMGTKSHEKDLETISMAIEFIMSEHPSLEIIQIGGGFTLPGARMLSVPQQYSLYPEFVTWFRAIAAKATIGLAPLRDIPFNWVKSDIKALDYGFAKLPTIFSKIGPYLSLEDMKTGLLSTNDTESWRKSINLLLTDNILREKISNAAYARAIERSLNNDKFHLWEDAINKSAPEISQ